VDEAAVMVMLEVPLNEVPLMVRAFWRAVAVPALPEIEPEMVFEKVLVPLKVLLLARRVEEAAVIVIFPVPSNEVPLMVRALRRAVAVPALPETEPVIVFATVSEAKLAVVAKRFVEEAMEEKRFVVVAAVVVLLVMRSKMFDPEKRFEFARSVDEAAVIVMLEVPSNEVPFIVLALRSAVAVPAFPVMEPVMVFEKVLVPLKVLLLARSVDEAAVMVMLEVPLNEVPLMVRAFWRAVAVPALPETEPVMVLATVSAPKLAEAE
jgi:hypothetical protein